MATQCFLWPSSLVAHMPTAWQRYSQQPRGRNHPKCPSTEEWIMWRICTTEYYSEGDSDSGYDMDEPWEHHAK